MDLRTRLEGDAKAEPDLHALDGRNTHEGSGEQTIEPPVPVDVAAQARKEAEGGNFDYTTEGIAFFAGAIDGGDHLRFRLRVSAGQG
ncbi:MAG: hypothetical protein BWY77_01636 [bacterium ADurb.Bin431]|nr:MAG: hypothetical protein BWY77_01636 [bacterium ADurb.Bin431]